MRGLAARRSHTDRQASADAAAGRRQRPPAARADEGSRRSMIGDAWKAATYKAGHFLWEVKERVATVTLNRPDRKNPLTFESYAELRDLFRRLSYADDVRAVVITGAGGNFCS